MNIPQITYNSNATNAPPISPLAYSRRRNQVITLATRTQGQPTTKAPDRKASETSGETFRHYHGSKTHALKHCQKFRDMSYQQKKDFLFKSKLCFNCANSDKHVAKDCDQEPSVCDICQRKHNTVLHKHAEDNDTDKSSAACTRICGKRAKSRSCARIVLLEVTHASSPSSKTLTYAVLDDQSTDVFITDTLLNQLGADGQDVDLQVNTIVGTNTIRTKKLLGLQIQDVNHNHLPIKVPHAYTREDIPATHHDIATPNMARQWKHLKTVADKIHYRPEVEVGMLIGRNVPTAFQPLSIIYGQEDEPWAEE